jgi:hypothetical protein
MNGSATGTKLNRSRIVLLEKRFAGFTFDIANSGFYLYRQQIIKTFEEDTMSVCRGFLVGMMIAVLVTLGGCCGGGSTVKNESTTTTTTLGDELKALKDAYDQGIISEKEYNESKERIIKQRTETK